MKKEPAVLLVEDEPLLGELMTEALIDQGFEVHAAGDAGDALRHLVSGAEVDILFTDIDLGGGMDGAELAQLAREMRPKLPVVYRWAYDYSVPGVEQDFVPQNQPRSPAPFAKWLRRTCIKSTSASLVSIASNPGCS